MAMAVKRFNVYLVNHDPTVGHEIQKTRPSLVVSPEEMNQHIRIAIIAPMTTVSKDYPTRVPCEFRGKYGQIVLDQIRTIDQSRLVKNLGTIDSETQSNVVSILQKMFAF